MQEKCTLAWFKGPLMSFHTMRHKSADLCDKTWDEWEVRRPSNISVWHNQNLTGLQLCTYDPIHYNNLYYIIYLSTECINPSFILFAISHKETCRKRSKISIRIFQTFTGQTVNCKLQKLVIVAHLECWDILGYSS